MKLNNINYINPYILKNKKAEKTSVTGNNYATRPIANTVQFAPHLISFKARRPSPIQREFDDNSKARLANYKKQINLYKQGKYDTPEYKEIAATTDKLKEDKKDLQVKYGLQHRVKQVKGKEYQGLGLYEKQHYINWDEKLGWDNMMKGKNAIKGDNNSFYSYVDWEHASKDEAIGFWHAAGLAETHDDWWPRRYNPTNRIVPLSTGHTLLEESTVQKYDQHLVELHKIKPGTKGSEYLDKPIINPKNGKLNLEFVVFDTETTGLKTNMPRPRSKKVPSEKLRKNYDQILQIGALKTDKNGQPVDETAISQLVNPQRKINPKAEEVHHIGYNEVKDEPTIDGLLKPFVNDYIGDKPLVAYNAKFDVPLLNNSIFLHNREAKTKEDKIPEISLAKTIDPMILIQRIHPFIGASKKQTNISIYW